VIDCIVSRGSESAPHENIRRPALRCGSQPLLARPKNGTVISGSLATIVIEHPADALAPSDDTMKQGSGGYLPPVLPTPVIIMTMENAVLNAIKP